MAKKKVVPPLSFDAMKLLEAMAIYAREPLSGDSWRIKTADLHQAFFVLQKRHPEVILDFTFAEKDGRPFSDQVDRACTIFLSPGRGRLDPANPDCLLIDLCWRRIHWRQTKGRRVAEKAKLQELAADFDLILKELPTQAPQPVLEGSDQRWRADESVVTSVMQR